MGGIVEYNHDHYGKKFDDMNEEEQKEVKDYEEAMYGGNLEYPDSSDSSGLEDRISSE